LEKKKQIRIIATRAIAYSALLAALSIVLARLLSFAPAPSTRWSLDKFPIFLAGMFFGPVVGGLTGLAADIVGCLFSPYGINPLLSLPAILYGVFGGVFRRQIAKKPVALWLILSYAVPVVFGSILYQSAALAWFYNPAAFAAAFTMNLATRGVQFAVVSTLEVAAVYLLLKTGIFNRAKIWPPAPKKNKKEEASIMTAEEAVQYIHSITWMGSKPGLERTQELLRIMGNPEKALKFVHIAGTNGKGSTAAMTASVLQQAGYRVGLFTSPCLYKFNERIQINGEHISDEDLAAVTSYVKPLAASMEDHPTEFELVSCIGFEYFKRKGVDMVVLEVGMGGALDSTNVIPVPEVAVLTNIGLDHTDFLGSTLEEIAETKSGILKQGGDAVLYPGEPGVEKTVEAICRERNVRLKKVDFAGIQLISHSLDGQVFDCGDRKGLELPLLGNHQLHNAAVVLAVIDTLIEKGWSITEENIRDGLRTVSWPGRFEIVKRDPLFIIDGGHNPQCLEALVKNIQDYLADRKVIALTGVLADKDYAQMYQPVMPLIREFVCITPPNPRKLDSQLLAQYLKEAGAQATACETVTDGVRLALEKAGDDGVVLCFGSLYTIADIRAGLEEVTK